MNLRGGGGGGGGVAQNKFYFSAYKTLSYFMEKGCETRTEIAGKTVEYGERRQEMVRDARTETDRVGQRWKGTERERKRRKEKERDGKGRKRRYMCKPSFVKTDEG